MGTRLRDGRPPSLARRPEDLDVDAGKKEPEKRGLRVLDFNTGESTPISDLANTSLSAWSADCKELVVCGKKDAESKFEIWRVNVDDPSKKVRLPLAENDFVLDWSVDGKSLLTLKAKDEAGRIYNTYLDRPTHLVGLDGKDLGRVFPAGGARGNQRFTPDGKRVVYIQIDLDKKVREIRTVGLDGKDDRLFVGTRGDHAPFGATVWSPDRNHVAFCTFDLAKNIGMKPSRMPVGCRLEIADADAQIRDRSRSRKTSIPSS